MMIRERWTEEELHAEIRRLDVLIERASRQRDERSRCAASYLSVLRRDRHEKLAGLRARRRLRPI